MGSYQDHAPQFESQWQARWMQQRVFDAPNPGQDGFDQTRPKKFVLDMFPYPSGAGLHVGHPLGYIGTDVYARFLRMTGHNVLHSMGFDSFGLPAEQYAIQTGQHPRVTTEQNVQSMLSQLRAIGLAHDESRRFSTTDPDYYRWTQWIFLQLYNSFYDPHCKWTGPDGHENVGRARPIRDLVDLLARGEWVVDEQGVPVPRSQMPTAEPSMQATITGHVLDRCVDKARLAYLDEQPVNWCPMLGTVLANEEVTADGRSERGNFPVYRRPLRQWMLRITAYAERLEKDLSDLAWPPSIIDQQRNWIGRSEGAEIAFELAVEIPPTADVAAVDGAADGASLAAPPTIADDEPIVPPAMVEPIVVFTTRPDTVFGATYLVLAPEHPLVDLITTDAQREAVTQYQTQTRRKTDDMRQADAAAGVKTGVFTGALAINPLTRQRIAVWISDYVLMGYGTGAIMAVPAHDERDFAFARQFKLPIVAVVQPPDSWLREQVRRFGEQRAAADARVEQVARSQNQASKIRTALTEKMAALSANLSADELAALRDDYLRAPGEYPEAFVGEGLAVNSEREGLSINGLTTAAAKRRVIDWLVDNNLGAARVQTRLRDWLFSRQRYWGEPFPVVYDDRGRVYPLAEDQLPLVLPDLTDFNPRGNEDPNSEPQPPLARATDWMVCRGKVNPDGSVTLSPDGRLTFKRDPNTMPNWAGSCWYYLRYCDPRNQERFVARDAEKYWMVSRTADGRVHAGGVDLYVGGTEHAVLHLLYARFWHKVLYDLGHVSTREPFGRLFNQGMITADAFVDDRGIYVPADQVVEGEPVQAVLPLNQIGLRDIERGRAAGLNDEQIRARYGTVETRHSFDGKPVFLEQGKMGKSLKNTVDPVQVIQKHSVDTFRLYEMYMGPLDASKPWNARDIIGMQRFCSSVWRLAGGDTWPLPNAQSDAPATQPDASAPETPVDAATGHTPATPAPAAAAGVAPVGEPDPELERLVHQTIAKVTDDIAQLRMNTAIAALIELTNALSRKPPVHPTHLRAVVLMVSPFAPHLAEEIFSRLYPQEHAQARSVTYVPWPKSDPAKCIETTIEVPIQVNGKLRSVVTVSADADDDTIREAALQNDAIQKQIAGKDIRRLVIVRKGTPLVNIVL